MVDTPEPGAALLDRPAAVANGHDLDALMGCLAPGYGNQAAAHPARGFTGTGRVRGDWTQIVILGPGLATALRSAGDAGVMLPQWQGTSTRAGTDLQMTLVIIVRVSDGALPSLALRPAAGAVELRRAPGDRRQARDCWARARKSVGRHSMRELPGALAPAGRWSLRRDGQDWLLEAGPERARLRDSRGLHYLRALLAAPGAEIPALDLAAGGPGLAAPAAEPLLDPAALDAYRCRIRQLDSELGAADRAGDPAAADRAHRERQALLGELRRATGLAGRPRRAPADAERARVNVTRSLRAAIDRITANAPIAGAHLQASIRTGNACRYQPAPGGPARWHT